MPIIIIWAATIFICVIMDTALALKLLKDVADCGYKLKLIRLQDLRDEFNLPETRAARLGIFIPLINILLRLQMLDEYKTKRHAVLGNLHALEGIEQFAADEQQKYNLRPTGLNALFITAK